MVAPARRAVAVLLALLVWPALRRVGTDGDGRHRRRGVEDPRAGLQLPEGRSARSTEGWQVGARGARRDGAARAGKSPAATARRVFALSYDSLGGTIRCDDGGRARPVRLPPDDGRRRGLVRRAAGHFRQRAWGARPRFAVLDSARVPCPRRRRLVGCGGLGLHAAGAHRRAESPPPDRVVGACARGRSVPAAVARARPRRDDQPPQSPDRRLRRVNPAAARGHRLDHHVAPRSQPALCDNRRARSTLADARDHREAVLPAGARRAEAGRPRGSGNAGEVPAADAAAWPEPVRSFWESGEPERFGVSGASGERVDYMRRVDGPGDAAASRSTAATWVASAWSSCRRRFDRRGAW